MDAAVVGGLFALGGVALGAVLSDLSSRRGRRELIAEQREQARHTRELDAAELLDQALVKVSLALDRDVTKTPVQERYSLARNAWQQGWVAHSSRIQHRELLERVEALGTLLQEATMRGEDERAVPPSVVARAIANARAGLARFMRGEPLEASAFSPQEELLALLGKGDGTADPLGPLKVWLAKHPDPDFHPPRVEPTQQRRRLAP
jgi:hypothetical protein